MADDLEAFLRQAAEQRLAKKRAAQQRAAGPQQPQQPSPRKPAPRRKTPSSDVVDAVLAEPRIGEEGVGEHVARHLDESKLQSDVAQLGENVEHEQLQFEDHIRATFDHDVSRLDTMSAQPPESTKQKAGEQRDNLIVRLLRDRHRVREAIILSEILNRPPGLD